MSHDLIISGGENIYPIEVENAILSLQTVSDVCVIGIPSEKWGEAVVSLVEFKRQQTQTKKELIDHCKQMLTGHKIPKEWILLFLRKRK